MHLFSVRKASLFAVGLLFVVCPAFPQAGSPPPTYDYDPATAGTQPPQSPFLNGFTYRSVRTYQFTIPVYVPISEIAPLLPAGFDPVAAPAGSDTTLLNLGFFLDQRFQPALNGPVYGPTTALLANMTALNNNVSPARQEIVFPLFEASAEVDALNGAFGAGSARLAHVKASVTEEDGILHFAFDMSDPEIGFSVRAKAECPAALTTRSISDPVGLAFRALNGQSANPAFRASSQSDTVSLSPAAANVQLVSPGHRLNLRGGAVSIVGIGPSITFNRNLEFVIKFE